MQVAIVGCGLVGRKRATALSGCSLLYCADIIEKRAQELATLVPHARAVSNWENVLQDKNVDIVIVSTPNGSLAQITQAAVRAGKHVLVEKPAARNSSELLPLIHEAEDRQILVRVGFNHRYHPALQQAKELVQSGVLGALMYVRGRYGHGGRLNYEKEWRANPELSGGGELIDQGIHLIDLARWFLGDFTEMEGFARTFFWEMPVEDNGFMILRTPQKQVAFLHASWTEWKNLFSFEVFGRSGKIEITGLGGSYGPERLTHYRMLPGMGPPEVTTWEYPMEDKSWASEFGEFVEDIRIHRQPSAGLQDAYAALTVIEKIKMTT